MNRIEERLAALQAKNEKAFITYMTAGLPSMEGSIELLKAQEEGGIDIVEFGIPFSDPIADGPVIQDASFRSIQKGTTLAGVFDAVAGYRADGGGVPLVFMLYYNTILHYGVEQFVDRCIEVGVDGLIIPDLPYEEQDEIRAFLGKENAPILIQLVSPISADRIPMICEGARGFIYCVSAMGVTGQSGTFHRAVGEYLANVKQTAKIPVMMGFGIRTAADVLPYKDSIDGAIVGSHFIRLMDENNYDPEVAKAYVRTFKEEFR